MTPKLSKPQFSNLRGEWVYYWNDHEISGFGSALEARQDQLEMLRAFEDSKNSVADQRRS